jgi:hypothetical protein
MDLVAAAAVSLVVTWLSFAALMAGLAIRARRDGGHLHVEIEIYHRRVFSYDTHEPEGEPE